MSRIVKIICICLVCWTTASVATYSQHNTINADSMFMVARDAAFNDRWQEARRISRELLAIFPDYYDAMLLIGRTYAWEHKTDSARLIVRPLLNIQPDSHDALTLLSDNEIWSGNYDEAITVINQALLYYPTDEDFLFKKANAYYLKRDYENAEKALEELFSVNPDHERGKVLEVELQSPPINTEWYDMAELEIRNGNWEESRRYSRMILSESPDHFPTLLLMAYSYAFENQYDSARHVTSQLYRTHFDNKELLHLMINIEIWNRKYKPAMAQVNDALTTYPEDPDFLYKKALIEYLQRDYNKALGTLDHILDDIDPTHTDAIALKNEILQNYRYRDYVFHEHYFEYFRDPRPADENESRYYSRKWLTSTGLAKWTKHGTYIGKVNIGHRYWGADRFDGRGNPNPYDLPAFQFEAEAYQNLWPTNYLWLNHAWSPDVSKFFPTHRGGIEFFQRIPDNYEASLGLRYMYWDNLSMFYTLSISWMSDFNYLCFRMFLSPAPSPVRGTYILTYRRYFSQRPEYFYALAGYGNYSDDFLHINPNPRQTWLMQVGIHKFITQRWFFLASAGYTFADGYRTQYNAQAGVRYYFNMFK